MDIWALENALEHGPRWDPLANWETVSQWSHCVFTAIWLSNPIANNFMERDPPAMTGEHSKEALCIVNIDIEAGYEGSHNRSERQTPPGKVTTDNA